MRSAHVDFLVSVRRHVSLDTAHWYDWDLIEPHVGHGILSLERSLSVLLRS